jgi:peptide/nickel transport system substrate-binding protein
LERLQESGTGLPGGQFGRRQFLRGVAGAGVVAGSGGLIAACSSSPSSSTGGTKTTARRKPGGNLKVGMTGGSTGDQIDPHKGLTYTDTSRLQMLYSPLVQFDGNAQLQWMLAEENGIVAKNKDPKQWLMHLRKGVTFHNGRPFTSADVVYSFQRIIKGSGPGAPYSGATGLGPIDINGVKALDKYTVYVPMKKPFATLPQNMAAFWYYLYIAPVGFDINKPVGTGPFMYKSFKAGQQSVFVKNPHYFISGRPYADTLTIIDFPDSTSLQNALVTKVIQAAGALNGPQIATLTNSPGIKTVVSHAGTIVPFTMRLDRPPFTDVNVRQALRYVVDRPQLIDSALDGYGTVGNDVFSPYDPAYNRDLHRAADIPRAKKLLKQAGKENLQVTLTTSAIATGTVAMATVLKQQAAQAGINIKLNTVDPGTFFSKQYLSWDFAQDFYNYSPYMSQVAYSMLPQSPFNETHNDNKNYTNLYNEANQTFDEDKRTQILHEMQQYDFNQGGYIIPAYVDSLDAYSTDITGYSQARLGQPLGNFTFENMSFVQ